MENKITVKQAFNNLCNTIEGIRFLPAENNKIQQAVQILASIIDMIEEVKEEEKNPSQE